ncbi:hypothetical protein UCREL1_2106 [Eutypa lata UCREL1]|uniref:N-acetylgalactosaminide beta-1,3-galactosyltransferase n=1 Tax=Eutypa lata (strain UCR-EL1) TaxID=1287681 RepID=M7TLN4_EUTLA|nr:hypothetical protein UCREL1_2106 [Eutypa lata UCREL1]
MYLSKISSTPVPSVNSRFVYRIPPCGDYSLSGLEDVLVVLKTGANEAPEKLPASFASTLRCAPNYVIYSDFEETIDGHPVHNALDKVNPEIVATHPEFEYYRLLQEHGRDAFTEAQLAEWSSAANTINGRDSPGWRLDKWKFLPMAEKALKQRPETKWFVFIEADTYIIWKNIIKWLSYFNPSKLYYMGLQMSVGNIIFAYGGAGFILSKPALEALVEHRSSSLEYYDNFTANHWAGDCVMGKALKDAGVPLFWSWPTLISENPAAMNFEDEFGGMKTKRLWCHYAATYHHLSPEEVLGLSDFEEEWNAESSAMIRHKDVFRYHVLPHIRSQYDDWDNLSSTEQSTDSSFEECRQTCESQSDCIQFSLSGRTCRTGTIIKLGRQRFATTDERVVSGWMIDRVHEFVERNDALCKHEEWVLP